MHSKSAGPEINEPHPERSNGRGSELGTVENHGKNWLKKHGKLL